MSISEDVITSICEQLNTNKESIRELRAGFHNHIVLLNEKYVLRSGSSQLKREYAFLSENPIGPEAYLYDEQSNTLVTQYIDAPHPERYDEELVIRITDFIHKLQDLPVKTDLPQSQFVENYLSDHQIDERVDELYAQHQLPPREDPVYVHTDLAKDNLLLSDPLTAIDWEFVTTGPPEQELAHLSYKLFKQPALLQTAKEHYKHPIREDVYRVCELEVALQNIIHLHQELQQERPKGLRHVPEELIRKRLERDINHYHAKFCNDNA